MPDLYAFLRYELTGLFVEGLAVLILVPVLSPETLSAMLRNGVAIGTLLAVGGIPAGYIVFQFMENHFTTKRRTDLYLFMRRKLLEWNLLESGPPVDPNALKDDEVGARTSRVSDAHVAALVWLAMYPVRSKQQRDPAPHPENVRELVDVLRGYMWHSTALEALGSVWIIVAAVLLAGFVGTILALAAVTGVEFRIPDAPGIGMWVGIGISYSIWSLTAREACRRTHCEARTIESAIISLHEETFKDLAPALLGDDGWLKFSQYWFRRKTSWWR